MLEKFRANVLNAEFPRQVINFPIELIPNKISSIVGEKCELFVALNYRMTSCMNDLVKEQWINV